jgi:extracellular elastinolytic metalloproteinase
LTLGWGDFFAAAIGITKDMTRDSDYHMGQWINGQTIRPHAYSTDMTRNPTLYTTLNDETWQAGAPHTTGSIWGNMLYEMMWNMIDKHGYSENRFPEFEEGNPLPTKGVQIAMKLVLEGMKLSVQSQ